MQYSPKLKKAIQEIKDILSREDIAGVVVLHEPGHSEFLVKVDPTYSCVKIKGDQIRIKAKLKEDFNGDKKAWTKKVGDSANMLHLLSMTMGDIVVPLMDLSHRVDKVVKSDHSGGGFSSHTTQNN